MVASLGLAFVVFFVFIAWFLIRGGVDDRREQTAAYSESLALIDQKKAAYLEKKARAIENTNGRKPMPLRTLVDRIGTQLDVEVPEVKELPDQHRNPAWIERSVELTIRETGLVNLTKFMEEVEAKRKQFPIAITRIEIRKIQQAQDRYNVKMVITTYEPGAEEPSSERSKANARGAK